MTKTANEVVTHALKLMKIIASDEAPTPEDLRDGTTEYIAFHDVIIKDLQNAYAIRGGNWSYDSVPDNVMPHVAKMLAEYMLDMFPVADDTYQKVSRGAITAKSNLHSVLAKPKKSNRRFPTFPKSNQGMYY